MNEEKDLDIILLQREVPAPSTNLAYRISQAAREKTTDKTHWYDELWRLFIIPKPAYVTAFCLLIGLYIGVFSGVEETSTQEWFSFLEEQEEGWL